jgi:hypothetical protein
LRTLAPAVSIPSSTASSSSARPALMIKPPSWILRRVSAFCSAVPFESYPSQLARAPSGFCAASAAALPFPDVPERNRRPASRHLR